MSDLELLFLVLGVVYAWECACWLPRGSIGFLTWLGRQWRPTEAAALLGNRRGGFILAHPLPPLGTILTANRFPLSLSPHAVLAYVPPGLGADAQTNQIGKLIDWNEIRSLELKGKAVMINGELWLKAASRGFAEHVLEQLWEVRQSPPAKRESTVNEVLRAMLDTGAIKKRWEEFHKQTTGIRRLANFLFVYLFILSPSLIWRLGLQVSWAGLLAGLLLLTAMTAILFRRAHKVLYPHSEDERFTHFLTVLLSPATTIRAQDILSRPLLEGFHPLAIATVFCSQRGFLELSRRVLRELRHPPLLICPRTEAAAEAVELYWRTALEKTIEAFLRTCGFDPEALRTPPAPADATCVSFCPRCLAQFTTREGACADCGGVPLVAFHAKVKLVSEKPGEANVTQ